MNDVPAFISAAAHARGADDLIQALLVDLEERMGGYGREGIQPAWFDAAFVFLSAQFTRDTRRIVASLRERLKPGVLMGCTAEGVISHERELENEPAVSVMVAHLPGVKIAPFALAPSASDWHRLLLDADEFRRAIEVPVDSRLIVLLGDPFSTPMDDVLQAFNTFRPGVPVAGGMASGALRSRGNVLFLDDVVTQEGLVGVAISGAVDVDVLVSQGCRPIWRPFKVTAAHRNVIYTLEGRPPLAWIQELVVELSEEERALLQNGLFVGRAILPGQEVIGRGDFLIRGLMGIDHQNGSIAISDSVVEGEIIQFHVQDALTAQEDLEMLLIPQLFRQPPEGGLIFACNGRGTRLYDHPNGDISIIRQNIEGLNLAGFFCAGEIGPVAGVNYLHTQSVSLALFRPLSQ